MTKLITICDHCSAQQDESFTPYNIRHRKIGRYELDLCDICFELLRCSLSEGAEPWTEKKR